MSRLNGQEIKDMREILIDKYGSEFCARCNLPPEKLGVQHLQLHEIRYNLDGSTIRPLDPNNFVFLCRGCNKRNEVARANMLRTSSVTQEHKKSLLAYPLFIRWLDGEINKPENNHHLNLDQTIDQAAYEIGMKLSGTPLSPVTIKRYMQPLCDHPTSPYVTAADNNGQFDIWVRGYEPKNESANSRNF